MSVVESSTKVGKQDYWRSLSELEGTAEFEQFMQREFPQAASEFPEGVSRRRWLKLMSASLAMAGAAGCRYGPEEIASFVVRPANSFPGIAKRYATNFQLADRAVHALVVNYEGRPLKVDGNPAHPIMRATEPNQYAQAGKDRFASAGSDVFTQACILGLYDPDRLDRVIKREGGKASDSAWTAFAEYAGERLAALKENGGKSLAIIMSPSLSPSVNRLVGEAMKALPQATLVNYSAVDTTAVDAACAQAAGQPAELLYKLDAAKVICCFDSDLLGNDPNVAIYSRQFAKRRDPDPATMNRLYAIESRFSTTGATADFRLPVRTSEIEAFLAKLEKRVDELLGGGQTAAAAQNEKPFDEIEPAEQVTRAIDAMAEDLVANKGAAVVSVGSHLPKNVQLGALRLNQKIGAIGKTVLLMPSRKAIEGAKPVSLSELAAGLKNNQFDTVWILGDNPVYTAPRDIDLGSALKNVAHTVYMTEIADETAEVCAWTVPQAHPLECWGDVRGVDGSYGIGQPQIEPLLDGKSPVEILAILTGQEKTSSVDLVKATAASIAEGLTNRGWEEAVHNGFAKDVTAEPLDASGDLDGSFADGEIDIATINPDRIEVVIYPSDALYDGRFANNVWLQELPQQITKLVWDNAALVSPQTAKQLQLNQGELVSLRAGEGQVQLPVFIVPGQANGSIAAALGYGRACNGLGTGKAAIVGKNVGPLRTSSAMHVLTGVAVSATSLPYRLSTTQDHFAIDKLGLDETARRSTQLIREGTLEQITSGPDWVEHLGLHHPPLNSLWKEPIDALESDETVPYQWGMAVDLNKCTGCSACVIACQSENNVPVVGKEQVYRGREMHWMRVDRYYSGNPDAPKIVNQPVMCMHCETAPCEQVCPVAATVHTEDGINHMAYNRCIGTRYCGNNCPYKVRRFNYINFNTEYGYFYGWQDKREEANRKLQQLVLNPDVSVRGRGVMEKCTYCIQRVQNGKITARNEGRRIEDGEVQTACMVACPTQAIIFGDLKDPASMVTRLHKDPRNYAMLEELNTKPRTLYLARVRNVHPRLKTAEQLKAAEAHHSHGTTESGEGHGEHS
ncbi:MAG: TAT-variant-translocated molybdopterin oxidoreductase [Aureliella sp.]